MEPRSLRFQSLGASAVRGPEPRNFNLDHGDDISMATVTGIETVVLLNTTVTMTVVQHNSFTNINDNNPGTPDTINLVGSGAVVGDADIETYNVISTTTAYAGELPASTATPARLEVNSLVTSQLEFNGDSDWFATNLVAGHRYQINLMAAGTGLGTVPDTYVYLHDANGNVIAQNDDGGPAFDSVMVIDIGTSGAYYVDAQAYGGGSSGTLTMV